MSTFALTCLWCVLQVTLLSAIGIAISLLVARRYPVLAATSTTAVVMMAFVATLLVPVRIPQWSLPESKNTDTPQQSSVSEQVAAVSYQEQQAAGGLSFDLNTLAEQAIAAINHQKRYVPLSSPAVGWIKVLLMAGGLVGIFRFVGAVYSVTKIRRKSRLIDDEQASHVLQRLAQVMSCPMHVQLHVSSDVQSPAVLGWLKPLIVLPPQWKTWESTQLQAVLAHELAHIVRHDFFWRVLGTFTQAVHFYHPLAHWLLRRLAYSQELAADQLAAAALGSRTAYSKALSELAIRQDGLSRLRAEPILLPTLSSHLIRRIKMLRAMECLERGGLHLAIRVTTVAVVATLGMATVAMRGIAQPADTLLEQPSRKTWSEFSTGGYERQPLLDRQPSLPLIDGENEQGVFVIKVAEIMKEESLQPYLPLVQQYAASQWRELFSVSEAPHLNLEAIDHISGMSFVEVRRLDKEADSEHKNLLMIGGPYALVRFNRDISSWQEWVRQYMPTAEELSFEGRTYFRLPVIPAIGPQPGYIAAYDDRTLITAGGDALIQELLAKDLQQGGTQWNNAWKSLDTGLASLLSSNHEIDPSLFAAEDPDTQALDQILDNINQVGYSVDWNDEIGQMGVKIQLYCSDQESAESVSEAIATFSKTKLEEATSRLAELDAKDKELPSETPNKTGSSFATRQDCLTALEFLETYQERIIVNTDETVTIEAIVTMDFSLVEFFQELIQPPKTIAQAGPKTEKK